MAPALALTLPGTFHLLDPTATRRETVTSGDTDLESLDERALVSQIDSKSATPALRKAASAGLALGLPDR